MIEGSVLYGNFQYVQDGRVYAERSRRKNMAVDHLDVGRRERLPGMTTMMDTAVTRTHTVVDSPVGELTAVLDKGSGGWALAGLYFPGHLRKPPAEGFGPRVDDAHPALRDQLAGYFAGDLTTFDLPLALRGNDFQLGVWALLQEITGRTRSTATWPATSATRTGPRPSATPTR